MKRKVLSDALLNIFATILPMFMLQMLILPIVATRIDSKNYGQLLSLVALINLLGGTAGNVLNNLRLINYKKYTEKMAIGDYNILLISTTIFSSIILLLYIRLVDISISIFGMVIVLIITILLIIKGYARVEFRLNLNFKYILFDSLFLLGGYLFGFVLFLVFNRWEFIYLFGFLFSLVWINSKTDLLKEPIRKTVYFNITKRQLITLYVSGILVSLGMYVDRLLIYPLLGGTAVSIYYTATILGKSISMIIQPLTSVMLSYLAHLKSFETKKFNAMIILSLVIGIIGYIVILLVSKPVLSFIYPQYVGEAIKYITITTASIMVTILSNIINSVLLKFRDIKWQVVINLIYMVIYFSSALILLRIYGLKGFCWGILIASVVKLCIMLFAYYRYEQTEIY